MGNVRIADATRDSMMDQFDADCNAATGSAVIKFYSGTQPATADTALSGNTLLATLTASAVMWGVSANGVLTLATVTDDSSADATGTASFARVFDEEAGSTIFDCDVAASGATINLNTVSIIAGGTVSITSGTMTFPDS